jgi:Outer membrane protein beta-barrel domain
MISELYPLLSEYYPTTNQMKTIKQYILSLIAICTISSITAQTNKWHMGFEAGPTITSIYSQNVDFLFTPSLGYCAGVSAQYNADRWISVRMQINYERKGGFRGAFPITDVNGVTIGSMNVQVANNYITAPLMLRAQFGKTAKFYLDAGAYGGYLTRATSTERQSTSEGITFMMTDITQFRDFFDHGLCGGLGVEAPLGNNTQVTFGMRYNHGQANIQGDTKSVPLFNRSLNFVFGISQGF